MAFKKITTGNSANIFVANTVDKTNYVSLTDTNDILYYVGTSYDTAAWANPLNNGITISTTNITAPNTLSVLTEHPPNQTAAELPYTTNTVSSLTFDFSNVLIKLSRLRLSIIQTDINTIYEITDTLVEGFTNGNWEEIKEPGFLNPGTVNQTTSYQLINPGESSKFYSRFRITLTSNGGFGINGVKICRLKFYGTVKYLSYPPNSLLFSNNSQESGGQFKPLTSFDLDFIHNTNNSTINFKTSGSNTLLGPLTLETNLAPATDEVLLYNNATTRFESSDPAGTTTGKLVRLQNVSGNPGLPAVDGSLLLNLPSGGGGGNSLTRTTFTDTGTVATKTKTSNYMVFEGTADVILESMQVGTTNEQITILNNSSSDNALIIFRNNTNASPTQDFVLSGFSSNVSANYKDFSVLLKGESINLIYDSVLQKWVGNGKVCSNYTGSSSIASNFVCPWNFGPNTRSTIATVANTEYGFAFKIFENTAIRKIAYELTAGSGPFKMAIFEYSSFASFFIGKRIAYYTAANISTGSSLDNITTKAVLRPGIYWCSFGTQNSSTFRATTTPNVLTSYNLSTGTITAAYNMLAVTNGYSALETPYRFCDGGTVSTLSVPLFFFSGAV